MWLEHLESIKQRRLCGVRKVRTTRAAKKQASAQRLQTDNMAGDGAEDEGGGQDGTEDEAVSEGDDEEDFCVCHR